MPYIEKIIVTLLRKAAKGDRFSQKLVMDKVFPQKVIQKFIEQTGGQKYFVMINNNGQIVRLTNPTPEQLAAARGANAAPTGEQIIEAQPVKQIAPAQAPSPAISATPAPSVADMRAALVGLLDEPHASPAAPAQAGKSEGEGE